MPSPPLLFARVDDSIVMPDSFSHAFKRIARRAGFPGLALHDLRHTHASLLLQVGIHAKIVSERLGHASIGITLDLYSHVVPGLQENAAARFEEEFTGGSGQAGEMKDVVTRFEEDLLADV